MPNFKIAILSAIVGLFFMSSCDTSLKPTNVAIIFKPTFNGEEIECYRNILHSDKQWHYIQLQFFLSNIQFKNDHNDQWENLSLKQSAFQSNNTVLLGEHCDNSMTQSNANWQLYLADNANITNISHIRFTLGLPFEVNHLNPLTQESPLNIPTMFWSWQGGHKFLRLEMMSTNDNWLFHLGSVGCKAASPLRTPTQECRYPNRYTFELPLTKESNIISLELAVLLNNIQLSEQANCQSFPDNEHCQILFNNLNSKNNESVFRLVPKEADNE